MRDFDAYLFDADGTLIDTKELIYQSFSHMGREMGAPMPPREQVVTTIGLPVRTQVRLFLPEGRDDEYYETAIGKYSGFMAEVYQDYLALFPGVRDGLIKLAAAGKLLAIVTSRRRASLKKFLKHLDIFGFFLVIVSADDTPVHKPNPDPALLAMQLLGVDAERSLFIGDAGFDVECARGAGVRSAFVTWGGNDVSELKNPPDYVVDTFSELLPDSIGGTR